jgi:hypothetical protein
MSSEPALRPLLFFQRSFTPLIFLAALVFFILKLWMLLAGSLNHREQCPGTDTKLKSSSVMKKILRQTCVIAVTSMLLSTPLRADNPPPGMVNFGKFTKPTNGELVEINLNSDTIAMAVQFAGKGQPDLAEAARGLHSIRVNVVGLDNQNREEVTARMKTLRSELDTLGWQQVVSVQEKKEDVGIYLKTRGREAVEGLVITVLDGRKEAVFINIVGDIKVEKLAALGDKLNLDALKKVGEALKKSAAPKE